MTETTQPYFLVIGLGASGISMSKFLKYKGENVIATDINESFETKKELNALGIETQMGFHNQETFNNAKVMVPSPGIPVTNKYIKTALQKGVAITSELDIFSKYNNLPVIAITGTNGKTTTTTLIGEMLAASGIKPFVGGNIGTPLVDYLMSNEKADVIVAEISSFQLDISKSFKPFIGLLLNISQDHLDRYESYGAYQDSKWSIFKHQDSCDKAVINEDVIGLGIESGKTFEEVSQKLKSKIFIFSSSKDTLLECGAKIKPGNIHFISEKFSHCLETNELKQLPGTHNQENVAAAAIACLLAGADMDSIKNALSKFKNLSHRMEFIRKIEDISFYNDSKATNTDAVVRAINCFKDNIILILGGREKGTDFSILIDDVKKSVKTIIAIGESKKNIQKTFKNICMVTEAQDMQDAVNIAFDTAQKNSTVLLSPACASFDMYDNYVCRGIDFTNHVNNLDASKMENI